MTLGDYTVKWLQMNSAIPSVIISPWCLVLSD